MLKVFLVEDEFVIREGIKNNIDWKAHGYEFCGEAGDGELAYPMIQKLRPDIVITDIRMPFMDGLELSRLIRKELPDTEIIILSGYQEFEYAKEAIKLGVAQYLSKPINGEELLAELDELSAKIEEKHRAIQIRERYLQEMEESQRAEKTVPGTGHRRKHRGRTVGIGRDSGDRSVGTLVQYYSVQDPVSASCAG